MKRPIRELFYVFAFLLFIIVILYWNFFSAGLHPYPGDFLRAWYEPWKTENFVNNKIIIPHKPVGEDIFRQYFPFKTLAIDSMKKLQFPLWNPYNGAGMPLLATINIGFLDPHSLFFFLFSYPNAWTLSIISQTFLIGIFTYLYCRKISLSFNASIFASTSFLLSGFVIVKMFLGIFGTAMAMMPLLLFVIESFIQDPKSRKIFILPLVVLITIVSTLPQISFFILSFSLAYFIIRLFIYSKFIKDPRGVLWFFVLFLIGIGLSGIQILPTLELLQHANMTSQSSGFIFKTFLLPLSHFVTLFIPNYYGNPSTYNFWGGADYIETVVYVGTIPCFFAFLYCFENIKKKSSLVLFFVGTIIITLLLTADWFLTRFLYQLSIPIIATSIPSRIFLLTTFAISILAGFGYDQWGKNIFTSRIFVRSSIFYIFFIGIIFATTLTLFLTQSPCPPGPIQNCRTIALRNNIAELALFTISFLAILLHMFTNNRYHRVLLYIPIILICISGIYNASKFLPFSSKETFNPENKLISEIKKLGNTRVFGIDEANITTNIATLFRFYDPAYYHPLYIKRYGEFIQYANTGNIQIQPLRSDVEITKDATVSAAAKQRRDRLFTIDSIQYLLYKNGNTTKDNVIWKNNKWLIQENKNVLSNTYLVSSFEIIADKNKMLKRLFDPSFNPQRSVILEKDISVTLPKNNDEILGNAVIKKYEENNIFIDVENKNNAILVLTDNFYPGWKAYIDDKETEVYRANYTFRGIFLPAGKHTVKFNYQPKSLTLGIIISIFSLCIYIFLGLRKKISNILSF